MPHFHEEQWPRKEGPWIEVGLGVGVGYGMGRRGGRAPGLCNCELLNARHPAHWPLHLSPGPKRALSMPQVGGNAQPRVSERGRVSLGSLLFTSSSVPSLAPAFPVCLPDGQSLEMEGCVVRCSRHQLGTASLPTYWLCHFGQKDETSSHLV